MRIACSDVMVPGKSLIEKANKLKKWGFDGISIFWDYNHWTAEIEDEIYSLEEKTGVIPCEFVLSSPLYGKLMSKDLTVSEPAVKMYKEAARVCGKIGAVTELEFEYSAQDPLPLFDPYMKMSEDDEKKFLAIFRDICGAVKGANGMVLLETINRYESRFLNCAEHCFELAGKVKMDNAGLLLDTFHMSIEEKNIAESIRRCGNLVKHVHLGDNNRLLPGYGNIDFNACFHALRDIGYEGFVNLECSTSGDPEITLPKTARWLRTLID